MPHLVTMTPAVQDASCTAGVFLCRGSEAQPVLDRRAALRCRQAAIPSSKKEYFLTATTPQALARGVSAQLVQKPRRVSPPQRRKKVSIIFSGDMCGGENTARPANVRAVRQGGRLVRCSRPQTLSSKKYYFFDKDNPAGFGLRGCLSMTLQAQRSVFLHWDAGELRLRQITQTALPSSRQTAS